MGEEKDQDVQQAMAEIVGALACVVARRAQIQRSLIIDTYTPTLNRPKNVGQQCSLSKQSVVGASEDWGVIALYYKLCI